MTDPGQNDIAPGRVWIGLTGIRYRVVEVVNGRVQLASVEPDLDVSLDARPDDLRRHFTLVEPGESVTVELTQEEARELVAFVYRRKRPRAVWLATLKIKVALDGGKVVAHDA